MSSPTGIADANSANSHPNYNSSSSKSPTADQSTASKTNHHQRSSLSQRISVDRDAVYELVKILADELKFYYSCIETKSLFGSRFCHAASMIWRGVTIIKPVLDQVTKMAHRYDFDPSTPGNGLRSIVSVVDICILHLLRLLKEITEQRATLLFRANYYIKELEAFVSAFVVLVKAVGRVYEYLPLWPSNELFTLEEDPDRRLIDLMNEVELLDQSPFFGRAIGFQFCSSMSRAFQIIGISLASYSLLWDPPSGLSGAASNLLTSGQYVINPEERAKRIYQVTVNSDITFCKAFWNLTEGPLCELPKWFTPQLAVNEIWDIPGDLTLVLETCDGRQLEVPPPSAHTGPRSLPVRILSYRNRQGVETKNALSVFKSSSNTLPPSPCLLFHVHGGGFVATSSKTHEPYLRHWAKSLNCPIVSVDYSLAPENPYPRATEEIYYAYAWVLANAARLGWTGERICFAGDSAGGLLLASTVLRLIKRDIRRLPDGLVLIYPAFLAQYCPSPARLLSLLDPLLPLGVVTRCLAAYTGNVEYLKMDSPSAQPASWQNGRESSQGASTDPPPPKKTLRDMVNSLYDERKWESDSTCSSTSSVQGDEEIVNFVKGKVPSRRSTTETESSSTATDQPNGNTSKAKPKPNFVLTSSSDEESATGEKETKRAADFRQFFHRQLSRTNAGHFRSQSDGAVSMPSDTATATEETSSTQSTRPFSDPNCITFTASCFDESLAKYLSEQESTKTTFRQYTAPLMMEHLRNVGESNGADAVRKVGEASDNSSQSTGSLASLTRASAAIGHKMGLYVVDNLTGWFNPGCAVDAACLLNGNDTESPDPAKSTNPLAKFHHMPVPRDPFLSPLLAPYDWLARFPKTAIVACHLDPLLDDSITFAKRLKRAGVDVTLDLMDSLPHGFLNLAIFSPECREAARICVRRMREILKNPQEKQ